MKIIIENGGSNLDWVVLGNQSIYSSNGINIFDSDEKIIAQPNGRRERSPCVDVSSRWSN